MKKYIARMLRRAANQLDPPRTPTWKFFEPYTISTSGSPPNYKVTYR